MITRRRLVITGAAALVAVLPPRLLAQQQIKVWRIGFLAADSRPASLGSDIYGGFVRGMRELGYVEGKNLVIDWRFADGNYERFPAFAAELVRLKVDLIVAANNTAALAAQHTTTTIPIVIPVTIDPVGAGLASSLARPGRNITGQSNASGDSSAKQLELLKTMVPKLSRVAVLLNAGNLNHPMILKNVRSAGKNPGITILPIEARTSEEIERGFGIMRQEHAEALIVPGDGMFNSKRQQIAELAAKNKLPSLSVIREYAESGGLMSYGQSVTELFRRAATYVDKIFKGARAGDLPIEQPTRIELVINRKTARALGLTIPQELILRADEVIE